MGFFRKRAPASRGDRLFCSAVIVAAGSATRMEGRDKIFEYLDGMPVLVHTMLGFQNCVDIDEIIIVTRQDALIEVGRLCRTYGIGKAAKIIVGGDSRAQSVLCGLLETAPAASLIAIHDGARPFASPELISSVVKKAAASGAAAPAIGLRDTIKAVEGDMVARTLPRDTLAAIQTPQVFEASLIKGAVQRALEEHLPITDDCSAVEALGMRVSLVPGLSHNIKLTTPADFAMAEGIASWLREEQYL